jgi:hypothetical protein
VLSADDRREFPGLSEADYAAVSKHFGIDMQTGRGDWPAALTETARRVAELVAAGKTPRWSRDTAPVAH